MVSFKNRLQVLFDSLGYARRLEEAGFSRQQARPALASSAAATAVVHHWVPPQPRTP
jgi:hypothetical protein